MPVVLLLTSDHVEEIITLKMSQTAILVKKESSIVVNCC